MLSERRCKLPKLLLMRKKTSTANGKAEQGLRGYVEPSPCLGCWSLAWELLPNPGSGQR